MIYQIPTIKDVPKSFNVTLLKDDGKTKPCSTVYSSKGIGEPGMIMCANILSAIRQAVSAHRKVIFYHLTVLIYIKRKEYKHSYLSSMKSKCSHFIIDSGQE